METVLTAEDAPTAVFTPAERRRAIVAATVGNGLEFYDFITFAFFAIQIGHTFFPSENAYLSLMASLATFGAGFITRPLGAYVLGGYADRHGRKSSMLISMTMMGFGILLLAFIWWLPVILIVRSDKTTGVEKLVWVLLIFFFSWFSWLLYLLIAPVGDKAGR